MANSRVVIAVNGTGRPPLNIRFATATATTAPVVPGAGLLPAIRPLISGRKQRSAG